MERSIELEDCIKEYRITRISRKKELLEENYINLKPEFYLKLDKLIEEQISKQRKDGQDKVRHIALSRLISSSFTESYEAYFWISNSKLYFDNNKSYVYWKPSFIYQDIENDMFEVERLLRKRFMRLEAFELNSLKRKLISDDWSLFEKSFYNLTNTSKERILNSSMQNENAILILYGDYMEPLRVIGRIDITEGKE